MFVRSTIKNFAKYRVKIFDKYFTTLNTFSKCFFLYLKVSAF